MITPEEKIKTFEKELKFILNPSIRKFAEEALKTLPDYFFRVAASSSAKYHSKYALGEGGLVRHVRACMRVAVDLYRTHLFDWMNSDQKDLVLVSLLLHDGYKQGDGSTGYTVAKHPIIAKFAILENESLKNIIPDEWIVTIAENVATHSGKWVQDYKTKEVVLDMPKNKMQNAVHLFDYIASRRQIEINFDIEVERE
jgi:hypothetical protein